MYYIQQLYTNCLAQAAYYIESQGEAIIIDPIRETEPYQQLLNERGARLKYILETHFHADFVSGHVDLARETGAQIIYGPNTQTGYEVKVAHDEERISLGDISIRVMHTPGHTPESTCYVLIDEKGTETAIFTGDTLFVGDVGRPDLLDGVMTKEELAGMMYESLQNKILPLADEVVVYPGHGPGSACGKSIGKETQSTIGEQRKTNYALQPMSKAEFIDILTAGISPAPAYFFEDAKINKNGYTPIQEIQQKGMTPLTLAEFKDAKKNGATIVDSRQALVFGDGFVPGSINIGLDGQFAIWAGTMIPLASELLIVCEEGKEEETVRRLARVGFQNIKGFLQGGFNTWKNANERIDMVISIDPEEFALDYGLDEIKVIDVRRNGEFDNGHVKESQNLPLDQLLTQSAHLDKQADYYIHCAGGYRSMVAASLLKKAGISHVKNVMGGFQAIKETNIPVTA